MLNPSREAALDGTGPVAIVVDNGWASASRWDERTRMIDRIIAEAEGKSRPVVVVPTASTAKSFTARIEAPAEARSTAAALAPQPFAPDRLAAAGALDIALAGAKGGTSIVWLSDDIDHDGKAAEAADKLRGLAQGGTFAVIEDGGSTEPLGVAAGIGQSGKLEARVLRPRAAHVTASCMPSRRAGKALPKRRSHLPSAQARRPCRSICRSSCAIRSAASRSPASARPAPSASSTARSQWHRVALISGESREQAQPLLAPLYYIEKALNALRRADQAEGVEPRRRHPGSAVAERQRAHAGRHRHAFGRGGQARRGMGEARAACSYASPGPRLENGGDELLPVPLRIGGRTLGGALSWSTPQKLAPIEDTSLFAGTPVPPDVTVNRQVLADPAMLGPDVHVWARLQDGTPLVTERKFGEGQIILFHVTANSDWSNLPLSGLFVEMLRRISALGIGRRRRRRHPRAATKPSAPDSPSVLPPLQTLDGFGILTPPPPTAQPVPAAKVHDLVPSLDHPPGYYGAGGSPRAVNVLGPKSMIAPLPALPAGAERLSYESESAQPLKSWLLLAALALLFADIIAVILLQAGGFALWRSVAPRPCPRRTRIRLRRCRRAGHRHARMRARKHQPSPPHKKAP